MSHQHGTPLNTILMSKYSTLCDTGDPTASGEILAWLKCKILKLKARDGARHTLHTAKIGMSLVTRSLQDQSRAGGKGYFPARRTN